jgi:hypothetical protein
MPLSPITTTAAAPASPLSPRTVPSSSAIATATAPQSASAQALSTVTQVAASTRNARAAAAAAAQRLIQLIAQVKILNLMGGDPKAVARQAAALAKEIGAQAQTLAINSSTGTDPVATAAEPSSETASGTGTGTGQQPLAAEAQQAEATAEGVATAAASPPTHAATTPPSTAPSTAPAGSGDTEGKTASDSDATGDAGDAAAAREALVKQLTGTGTSLTAPTGTGGVAPTLMDQVKVALSSLKSLIDRAAVKPHEKKKALKTVHDAETDVDAAARSLSSQAAGDSSTAARIINLIA